MRDHIFKNGKFYDVSVGSILADEWFSMRSELEYEKFLFEGAQPPPHFRFLSSTLIDRADRLLAFIFFASVVLSCRRVFVRQILPRKKFFRRQHHE